MLLDTPSNSNEDIPSKSDSRKGSISAQQKSAHLKTPFILNYQKMS